MKAIRNIIGVLVLLLCGCTHLAPYEIDITPEQLDAYTARALDIYANPSNWLEYGADQLINTKSTLVAHAKPQFMFSGHCGKTLGDDPYITVCIPVRTANSRYDHEFVAVTFHHPTETLKFVGFLVKE